MTRDWQRIGAISGILFFVTVFISFFTPSTPDVDDPTLRALVEINDDRTGLLLSVYLSGLGALFFLVFVAGLWSRLRAAEFERGPSTLVILGGVATAVIVLVVSGFLLALVEAADARREPAAIRALLELNDLAFVTIGWSLAAFYVGVALSAFATGSLPRWLGWLAVALVAAFVIGFLGIFGGDESVLIVIWFLGLLVNFLWILAASIVMLRAEPAAGPPPPARVGAGPNVD